MKESMGMLPTLAIVMAAFVLITSYLAFTINSNKAYKANSRIVSLIEKYDNEEASNHQGLRNEINDYLKKIVYNVSDMTNKCNDDKDWKKYKEGWCYKVITVSEDDVSKTVYTKVKTFISVDIPIFNRLFEHLEPFEINGSTKTTKIQK